MNPDLQVEVKPSIRARKIQEEKMRKQMQKEEYWRRREEEERWRMEMRYDDETVCFSISLHLTTCSQDKSDF